MTKTTEAMHLAGMVLAGGRSSRFGAEKAVQPLAGRPLLAWTLAALDGACETVAVSARSESGAAMLATSLGRVVLNDDPGHPSGPLAGLTAGLAWAAAGGFDLLATLPCDTPLVSADHIRALIAALEGADGAYAVTVRGPQPLCAVWRSGLHAALAARLAAGDHPAMRDLLAGIEARAVSFDDADAFGNANRPEDLARLDNRLSRAASSS